MSASLPACLITGNNQTAGLIAFILSQSKSYHIMQIVRGGKLSLFLWFSFQPWKFSSDFFLFYNKVFLGLKWQTADQALDLAY